MIAEIGHALLCLAALIALAMVSGAWGVSWNRRFSGALFVLVSSAFVALLCVYAISDFSVQNVYENSHSLQPFFYKLSAAWGNHEGSMLLWVWILTGYGFFLSRMKMEREWQSAALAGFGIIAAGFLFFILLTSNPFLRLIPPPAEGRSLNPLLQDIGLTLHPPLLYLGYVGFSTVSVLAVAALWVRREIDSAWAKALRPWALLAWSFLTAGIGMGSWWAYRELGWGGWWFWDPVENVSLLPWFTGTALVHCLSVLAKRKSLPNWTLLLAILTFTLSLIGTFLVRSGLLSSVHSFAQDPTRGLYVLGFVIFLSGGSFWLYARRHPEVTPVDFEPFSRESGFLVNNVLLAALCATVFLGVFYPIILQVLDMPSVSVGAPYYNTVVPPIAIILLLLAGVFAYVPWRRGNVKMLRRPLLQTLLGMFVVFLVVLMINPRLIHWMLTDWKVMAIVVSGTFLLMATLLYLQRRHANPSRSPFGMGLAHLGLALFAISAAFSCAGRQELETQVSVGDAVKFAGYIVQLQRIKTGTGENYDYTRAKFEVSRKNTATFYLKPEIRHYFPGNRPTAESSVKMQPGFDFYAAIAPVGDEQWQKTRVTLRLYYIPAMIWLWMGFVFASLGGMLLAIQYFKEQHKDNTKIAL